MHGAVHKRNEKRLGFSRLNEADGLIQNCYHFNLINRREDFMTQRFNIEIKQSLREKVF